MIHKDEPQPGVTPSGFAETWWIAEVPPWYGQEMLREEEGQFHPFVSAWGDDGTHFTVEQIDLEDIADEIVAKLASTPDDALAWLQENYKIEAHPSNPSKTVIDKQGAETAGDRSKDTILMKAVAI